MKQPISTVLFCLLLVFLPACGFLTPSQRATGAAAIEQSYAAGELTTAQRDAAIAALDSSTVDWTELALTGGSILASVLLGVPIAVGRVQKMRGPVATQAERVARAMVSPKGA